MNELKLISTINTVRFQVLKFANPIVLVIPFQLYSKRDTIFIDLFEPMCSMQYLFFVSRKGESVQSAVFCPYIEEENFSVWPWSVSRIVLKE